MRIGMLVFNQVGRGTYWRAFHFGRILVERGHQVTLLAISPKARLHFSERVVEGVRLVETPDLLPGTLRSGWDGWDTLRRILWLKGRPFDIIHAFEARPVVIGPALLAQQRGARLVMDWCDWFGRGGAVEERPNPLLRALLRPVETFFEEHFRTRAAGTTVINAFLRERAVQLGVKPNTICLLRNGSDTRVQPLTRLAARGVIHLPPEVPLIGYVGSSYTQDAYLMAMTLNQIRKIQPATRLVLIGYFNRDIETWLDDPGMVMRTGLVSAEDMYHYLAACDLCWLLLRNSGVNRGRWPMKLNDYLTVGRPVVATALGDLPEIMATHQFGVVASDNPEALAAQTVELLQDEARRDEMGRAARRVAETIWSWEMLAKDLERFYERVLQGKRNEL